MGEPATRAPTPIRATAVFAVALSLAVPATAAPDAGPYPDTTGYRPVSDIQNYRVIDEAGIWLTTPLGLRCGIDDDGSYGCSGDLPGAGSAAEVAWFVGDLFPRLYPVPDGRFRFSSPAAQSILPRETSISYRGSRCAVTGDSGIYCIHGDDLDSQILVTSGTVYRGTNALPGFQAVAGAR